QGSVFAIAEAFDAITVERGTSLFEIQPPAIDLDQMLDDFDPRDSLALDERGHAREELRIGNRGEFLHSSPITRACAASPRAARGVCGSYRARNRRARQPLRRTLRRARDGLWLT